MRKLHATSRTFPIFPHQPTSDSFRRYHSPTHLALLCGALILAACSSLKPAATAPAAPTASTAPACPAVAPTPPAASTNCPPLAEPAAPATFSRSLKPAQWRDLPGWTDDDMKSAWPAFLQSCRGMASRPHGASWKAVCELARQEGKAAANPRPFFEKHLQPYAVQTGEGNAQGLITGYYEPLLQGSRQPGKGYNHPIRSTPPDLLTVDMGSLFPELKDKRVRARVVGNRVVPYYSRSEIAGMGESAPGKPIVWVDDPIELFFLQVQGSGRVRLPDGSLVRVNYADQNGHPYQSIGKVLVERGEMRLEDASMQSIQAWARANPARVDALLNSNPSYVFFREMPASNEGPTGALGVPLTPERSLAVDVRSIPLGAPVFLSTTRPNSSQRLQRLMLAQDTGGAIKGAVRADFFWGFGKEAGEQAGRMKQRGNLWLLWPADSAPK